MGGHVHSVIDVLQLGPIVERLDRYSIVLFSSAAANLGCKNSEELMIAPMNSDETSKMFCSAC